MNDYFFEVSDKETVNIIITETALVLECSDSEEVTILYLDKPTALAIAQKLAQYGNGELKA